MEITDTQGQVLHTFEGDSLAHQDFMRQSLPKANFREADLTRTRLYNANLSGADFTSATLRWTNFQIANLSGAILRAADLANANLIDTNLCGADLTDAKLKWAIIKGTKYDATTKFPKGFDPKQQDMILVHMLAAAV